MSDKKRPRGGREAKVRLALDMCKIAHRRGDAEAKKRALETVCLCYDVDPTQLTGQGLKGMVESKGRPDRVNNAEVPTPSPKRAEGVVLLLSPESVPPTVPMDVGPVFDPETLDRLLDDIETFLTGKPSQG